MSFAFLPWYTGDYRRDTQHLSMMEHGAYLLMLAHCWDQRGPLPLDERRVFGICNARSNEEMGAVRHVLAEFFTRMNDGHYNHRMDREIKRAAALSDKLSTAGREGARKRKSLERQGILASAQGGLSQGQANAKPLLHTPTTTLTTTTTTTTPTPEKDQDAPVDPAKELWSIGVDVLTASGISERLARTFLGSMAKTWPAQTVLDACRAAIGKVEPKSYIAKFLQDKQKIGQTDPAEHWD